MGLALLDITLGGDAMTVDLKKYLLLLLSFGCCHCIALVAAKARQWVSRVWQSIVTYAKCLPFIRTLSRSFSNHVGGLRTLVLAIVCTTSFGAPVVYAQTASNRSMAWLNAYAYTDYFFPGDYNSPLAYISQCALNTYISSGNIHALESQVQAITSPCPALVNNTLQQEFVAILTDPDCPPQITAQQSAQLGSSWEGEQFNLPGGVVGEFYAQSPQVVGYIDSDSCGASNVIFEGLVYGSVTIWTCPVGMIATPPAGSCVPTIEELSITTGSPFIPGFSVVDSSGHVLTKSELTLTVTQGGQPDPGVAVPLQSDRGSKDQIDDGGVTNSGGLAFASVSTRDQPGTSTITSTSSDIETVQPGVITWLPAKYALPFLRVIVETSG